MIHFLPESFDDSTEAAPGPYAEAVSRLASIRQALACVEQFSGEAPSDSMVEAKLAAGWPVSSPARQRCFETRSTRTASAAEAGLEAITGQKPHPAAIARLKRELGAGVDSIDQLFSL
jgi:hypothetical protein